MWAKKGVYVQDIAHSEANAVPKDVVKSLISKK